MKIYADSLIRGFENSIDYIDRFGVQAEIRPIPDCSEKGVLDSRELPYAKAFLEMSKNSSSANAGIDAIRKTTGYVNYNINTVEIITDVIDIKNSDRNVRIWVYYPRKPFDAKDRAGFVYIHGGSFFAGSPFMCENVCRYLAQCADCVVFNVDYSLAPEKPFPAGLEDCRAAFDYVYDNAEKYGVDKEKLCIGGDSAGGNLAAAVNVSDVERRAKLSVYFYPCTTFDFLNLPFEWKIDDFEISDKQRELIEPKLCLGRSDGKGNDMLMYSIMKTYLRHDEDVALPEISPIYGRLDELNRSVIFTSEYDGLRYNGEYFAALLKKAGVSTRLIRYRGVFHAFMEKLGILPQAEDAILITANEMKKLFVNS